MKALFGRVSESFVRNQLFGPLVIFLVAAGAFAAVWLSPAKYLLRIESIALAWAAIMMGWAAWESRSVAMTSRNQLMPVIDIVVTHLKELNQSTNPPGDLTCGLRNVGAGPALNVMVHYPNGDGSHQLTRLGTFVPGYLHEGKKYAVVKRDEFLGISVSYMDVFGRDCESGREIIREATKKAWTEGPLTVGCK